MSHDQNYLLLPLEEFRRRYLAPMFNGENMVKFIATGPNGRKMLGLGLVAGNLEHLKAGRPIHFDREHLGLAVMNLDDILIFFGETEEAIEKEFREKGFVTDDTPIKPDTSDT